MEIFKILKRYSIIETQIIELINKDPGLFIECTLLQYSEKIRFSKSSIQRVVHKLGFDSYSEMKMYVKEKSIENDLFYNIDDEKNDTLSIINNIKSYNNFAINKTIDNLKINNIKEISNVILESRKILIFGISSSFLAAKELSSNLLKIGINAISFENIHEIILNLADTNKEDMIVIFSKSGNTKENKFLLKLCKENGIKNLIITNNKEIIKQFKYSILTIDIFKNNRLIATSSKIVQLIIADIIFFEIFYKTKNIGTIKKSKKILKEWEEFK